LRFDPELEQRQARRLAALRSERDAGEFRRRIDDLKKAATGSQNLLVPLREALRHRATVGEVCDALREVWGRYQPPDLG
jgi:methylmalonyl-CoA mutase N-terminal domain/subunit